MALHQDRPQSDLSSITITFLEDIGGVVVG